MCSTFNNAGNCECWACLKKARQRRRPSSPGRGALRGGGAAAAGETSPPAAYVPLPQHQPATTGKQPSLTCFDRELSKRWSRPLRGWAAAGTAAAERSLPVCAHSASDARESRRRTCTHGAPSAHANKIVWTGRPPLSSPSNKGFLRSLYAIIRNHPKRQQHNQVRVCARRQHNTPTPAFLERPSRGKPASPHRTVRELVQAHTRLN